MVEYMARDGYYMAYAIGTDLTAWRNADAALIVTEINALDWFISASVTHTKPKTINVNPMTAGHYAKRIQVGRKIGRLRSTHFLQTGILSYAVMGACTTAANGAEITTVECVAASAMTTADYFFINCPTVANYVWFQIDAAGADPTPGGTGIEVDIVNTDTAAQVATKLKDKMDAEGNYGAAVGTTTVTITNAANGAVIDASDGNTDFTIAVTTQGTSTHPITKATTETPISIGFHFEKEGTTAARRKDCLGPVPRSVDISVSEKAPIARQTYTCDFALTGTGGNLAQPTEHKQANLPPLTWYNYKNSSGASEFKYNSGAINVDIVDVVMHINWADVLLGTYDANGYPSNGLIVPPMTSSVDLGVRISDAGGTNLDDIADLRAVASSEGAAEYAGDLDFIADFYIGAAQYLKYTWDKMYVDLESYEEVFQEEGEWFDGARFTLRFLDENSSLAIAEINSLSKTYYEND